MPSTRSASRLGAQNLSPSKSHDEGVSDNAQTGSKRKAANGSATANKRGKKSAPKEDGQKTIEETIGITQTNEDEKDEEDEVRDVEMKEDEEQAEEKAVSEKPKNEEKKSEQSKGEGKESIPNGTSKGDGFKTSPERKKMVPSNLIEKGVIYFLTRSRVGIENPHSIGDLQRSFIVLRPLPKDAKISDGPIKDSPNARYIAIPKKTLPKGHSDRYMAFVEKAKVSVKDLKETYFKGEEYDTKTLGTRQSPPITPVGEGVYAITEVGRSTHLLYMLTIPSELGKFQKDLGLRHKGSFLISLKNPTRKGPSYANIGAKPNFPQDILDNFGGLAWMGITKGDYLDYANAQLLFIGEGQEQFGSAAEQPEKDAKDPEMECAEEEIEQLEHEDELRVEHLDGDDSIHADLRLSFEEYSAVPTTW